MAIEGILAFLQSPIGIMLLGLVGTFLAKKYPAIGAILHSLLDLIKIPDTRPNSATERLIDRVQDRLMAAESPSDEVKYELLDRALKLRAAGNREESEKVLDAACLILSNEKA